MSEPDLDKPLLGLGDDIPDKCWALLNKNLWTFQCVADNSSQTLMIGLQLTETAAKGIAEGIDALEAIEVTSQELLRYINRENIRLGRLAISGVVLLSETGKAIQALYIAPQ